MREDRLARHIESCSGDVWSHEWIAVAVSAYPRAEANQHRQFRAVCQVLAVRGAEGERDQLVYARQCFDDDRAVIVETQRYLIDHGGLAAAHFIRLPERGNFRS